MGEHDPNELSKLADSLRDFSDARDWSQFHSPKNLAIALTVETGELLEQFQWLTEEQSALLSEQQLIRVRHELADVMIYLVLLAGKLSIDLIAAANEKI